MRTKLTAVAVLAVAAVILASTAAAGPVAAQQQVAIRADRCDIIAAACWPALTLLAAVRSAPAELDSLLADPSGLVSAFAFDTRAPDTVYAATIGSRAGQGRIYKTTDGGHRWHSTTTRPLSTRVDALAADPRHPATLYAGTGVAVFKTMNGGRSWRGWNRGLLPPPPIIAPGQATGTPGWRRGEGWVNVLAVDPTDSNIVYAGTGGGVRMSTDGGHSWRTVLWHGRYMGISSLVIAPTSPQVVYAAAFVEEPANCGPPGTTPCQQSTLLYKSADGGKTWRTTGLGRASNPDGDPTLLAVDPQQPTTLYEATGRTVLKSTDAGRSWPITYDLPGKDVTSLSVDPQRSGTVYAGLWSGGIYKTTDGGVTWSQAIKLPVTALAVDPTRPATIYAGVAKRKYRIIRSTDSGRTWAIAG